MPKETTESKGLQVESNTALSWLTAIVLCAVAFATIGATGKDNSAKIRDLDREVCDNGKLITEMRLQSKEQEIKQQAIMSGLEEIKSIVKNLERAE